MRVTSEMMAGQSLRRLSSRLDQYQDAQSRLATGRRILAPSDDPSGASRAYTLRTAQAAREQEARNAADAEGWLNVGDSNLQTVVERLHRARDLAVAAASSPSSAGRDAIATELAAIREELIGVANSSHRGRRLFAGYSDGDAVTATAAGAVYTGDAGDIVRKVGDRDEVQVNVTAADVFWYGSDPTDNTFDLLAGLQELVRSGDSGRLTAALDDVDAALGAVGDQQVKLGAAANHVASALRRGEDARLHLRGELSGIEDVEIEEAILDLQVQEVAYQAVLHALGRALPPSLANFLR